MKAEPMNIDAEMRELEGLVSALRQRCDGHAGQRIVVALGMVLGDLLSQLDDATCDEALLHFRKSVMTTRDAYRASRES